MNIFAGMSQKQLIAQSSSKEGTFVYTHGLNDRYGNPMVEKIRHDGATAFVEHDPVTGAPLFLRDTDKKSVHMYLSDAVDSDVRLVQDDGSASSYKEFDPYGARVEQVTVVPRDVFDPFRYRFGLVDRGGTGRFLFGVRWYDPNQGVWVQQDSLDAPLDAVNGNRYAYAGSDPVNNLDPTGLWMATLGFEVCIVGCVPGEFGTNFEDSQIQWGAGASDGIDGNVSLGISSEDPVSEQEYDVNWSCMGAYYGGISVGGSINDALFDGAPPVTSASAVAGMGASCSVQGTTTLPL